MMSRLVLVIALGVLGGCSKSDESASSEAKKDLSATQQVLDGVTGRTAVKNYLNTKESIKDIEKKQKERFDKVP